MPRVSYCHATPGHKNCNAVAIGKKKKKKDTKGSCPDTTGEGIFSSSVRIDSHDLKHTAWLFRAYATDVVCFFDLFT